MTAHSSVLVALADAGAARRVADELRVHGFAVVTTTSARHAVEEIERSTPDAAFVDVNLGDDAAGGVDLLHWIRRKHPRLRLVASATQPRWFAEGTALAGVPVVLAPHDLTRLGALLRGKRDPGATPGYAHDDHALVRANGSI